MRKFTFFSLTVISLFYLSLFLIVEYLIPKSIVNKFNLVETYNYTDTVQRQPIEANDYDDVSAETSAENKIQNQQKEDTFLDTYEDSVIITTDEIQNQEKETILDTYYQQTSTQNGGKETDAIQNQQKQDEIESSTGITIQNQQKGDVILNSYEKETIKISTQKQQKEESILNTSKDTVGAYQNVILNQQKEDTNLDTSKDNVEISVQEAIKTLQVVKTILDAFKNERVASKSLDAPNQQMVNTIEKVVQNGANSVAKQAPIIQPSIESICDNQLSKFRTDLQDYKFPGGKNIADFVLRTGGQPTRSIVVTTWRSGSTFLGDILNAVPGNFYHYEPLLHYDIIQIRKPSDEVDSINHLKKLLNCDFTDMNRYLRYGQYHNNLFNHNFRLWNTCTKWKTCWNDTFLSEYCKVFPFHSMKIVRVRVSTAEELLKDEPYVYFLFGSFTKRLVIV